MLTREEFIESIGIGTSTVLCKVSDEKEFEDITDEAFRYISTIEDMALKVRSIHIRDGEAKAKVHDGYTYYNEYVKWAGSIVTEYHNEDWDVLVIHNIPLAKRHEVVSSKVLEFIDDIANSRGCRVILKVNTSKHLDSIDELSSNMTTETIKRLSKNILSI